MSVQDFNDTAAYRALQNKLADILKIYWWDKVRMCRTVLCHFCNHVPHFALREMATCTHQHLCTKYVDMLKGITAQ